MIRITESFRMMIEEIIKDLPQDSEELIVVPRMGNHFVSRVRHEDKKLIYLFSVPLERGSCFLYVRKRPVV